MPQNSPVFANRAKPSGNGLRQLPLPGRSSWVIAIQYALKENGLSEVFHDIVQVGIVVEDLEKAKAGMRQLFGMEPDAESRNVYKGTWYRGIVVDAEVYGGAIARRFVRTVHPLRFSGLGRIRHRSRDEAEVSHWQWQNIRLLFGAGNGWTARRCRKLAMMK